MRIEIGRLIADTEVKDALPVAAFDRGLTLRAAAEAGRPETEAEAKKNGARRAVHGFLGLTHHPLGIVSRR